MNRKVNALKALILSLLVAFYFPFSALAKDKDILLGVLEKHPKNAPDYLTKEKPDEIKKAIQIISKTEKLSGNLDKYEVNTSYKSSNGRIKIISFNLNAKIKGECNCGEERHGWMENCCVVLIDGNPQIIQSSNIIFLDAGDYAKNGKVEFLFKYESGFYDGYVLFYDEFRKSVNTTRWEYDDFEKPDFDEPISKKTWGIPFQDPQ